jgi:hypothetical protein
MILYYCCYTAAALNRIPETKEGEEKRLIYIHSRKV